MKYLSPQPAPLVVGVNPHALYLCITDRRQQQTIHGDEIAIDQTHEKLAAGVKVHLADSFKILIPGPRDEAARIL